MTLRSINPKNGRLLQTYEPASERSIEQALVDAEAAFRAHRDTGFEFRSGCLRRLADRLDADSQHWGRMLSDETGKTVASAVAEVD